MKVLKRISISIMLGIFLLGLLLPTGNGLSDNIICESDIQTAVCLPRNYSSMDIPLIDEPNKIAIEIHISDVLKINDRDFSITFSLYFNVRWIEPRLRLNPMFFQNRSGYLEEQLNPVDLNLINDLWVPNVFIYNLKTFKVIDVLSKLAGLWVNGKNEIMYSQASQITFICPMIFNYFPLDTQVCKFQVGSYSYNMEKMIFHVSQLGYAHTSRSIVLDYEIKIKQLAPPDRIFVGGALGNYSLAGFEMILHRHVSHYIINYYLPSGLFVVVSWISFLVPADIIPGRMALLVTLFLVLVNIFNTVTTNTPKAEGLTAIEAWMLACILFVFGTLTEYAGILFAMGIEPTPDQSNGEDENNKKGKKECNKHDTMNAQIAPQSISHTCVGCRQNKSIGMQTSLVNDEPTTVVLSGSPQLSNNLVRNGDELGDKSGFSTHRSSLVDANSSLLCQLHSHQEQHRLQNEQNDTPTHLDHLRSDNDKTKLFEDQFSKSKKPTATELQQIKRKRYARIDRFFLVIFPMMFGCFNMTYWIYYFSYNPMNLLMNSLGQEAEDGTVHVEEDETMMSSTTLSPEMLQALNEN